MWHSKKKNHFSRAYIASSYFYLFVLDGKLKLIEANYFPDSGQCILKRQTSKHWSNTKTSGVAARDGIFLACFFTASLWLAEDFWFPLKKKVRFFQNCAQPFVPDILQQILPPNVFVTTSDTLFKLCTSLKEYFVYIFFFYFKEGNRFQ